MLRNIRKSLIGMQDILCGRGTQSQVRNGTTYNIARVDIPYAVDTQAELILLDVTQFPRARIYSSDTDYVEYIYDANDVSGIAPDNGAGSWIIDISVPIKGTGTPEGAVAAPVGAQFLRRDGGAGTVLYIKETGTGNTGWVAK